MKKHHRSKRNQHSLTTLERRIMLAGDVATAVPESVPAIEATTTVDSHQSATARTELVFVDDGIEGAETLLDNVSATAEVILLSQERGAIDQISEVVAARSSVDSIHIVSHGSEGSVRFASGEVSLTNLADYAKQIEGWRTSLAAGADILIYGCDVAHGEVGREFVRQIADLTGSDVAASTDRTGNASRGGDWNLEMATGEIHAALAFDAHARSNFDTVLAVYQGNEYLLTAPDLTWEQAQAAAVARGGNLVSINDAAEEDFLQAEFGTARDFWIGINDVENEGTFVWANGDPVTYTNWAPFEPNDFGGQDYGVLNYGPTNQWDDDGAASIRRGIIEIPGGSNNDGSVIEVRAQGDDGTEQFQLQIDGTVVGTYSVSTAYQTFSFTAVGNVTADQVRIEFINDQYDPANGIDSNLRVDYVEIDGTRFESESPTTFSTGTWSDTDGLAPGFKQSEELHANGYFQYAGDPGNNTGTEIEVVASGDEGGERFRLLIDGSLVSSFTTTTSDQTFRYTAADTITADQVQIEFFGDVFDEANGIDANLNVDYISLDGVIYQTEAPTTFSTGTWSDPDGVTPGFKQSETLHSDGYFQYLATPQNFGNIQLASSVFNVSENDSSVDVTILRTGGSDGTVSVEYNSIDLSATAGQDYTGVSGTATFAPGQTSQTITIPILSDSDAEGDEQFSFAIDSVAGGAALLVPRTAIITIADDDTISSNGDGLLAEYFDNIDFTSRFPTQVDPTVNFDWGTTAPIPGMGADTYSVRWTGQIEPLYSETYTFRTRSDDGVRLWVDNQLIIDEWNDHAATYHTGTITLNAGQLYDIRMEYYENGGLAVAELEWSSASQALEIIPQSQLYSADPVDPPPGNNVFSQQLYTGLIQPTSIDFSPDGENLYMAEQRGIVKVARDGQVSTFIDIQDIVNGTRDRGLLDIAVHPDFVNNPYVYMLFTYDPPEVYQNTGLAGPDGNGNRAARLIRVTADASTNYTSAVANSEVILLGKNSVWENFNAFANSTNDFNEPPAGINPDGTNIQDFIATDSESHTIGSVEFGPDGALYVSIGDGTSYNRMDPRTVRVQDIDNLSGKILRIDALTGEGLSDNPFYNGDVDANRSKVYQYGVRNPFRITVDDATGQVYVGDVGWTSWEEINAAGAGANFGWPFYEGGNGNNLQTNDYEDLPEAAAFYANNNATPSIYALNHATDGINAIVLGDIYTGSTYPAEYQGDLFFNDLGQGIVRNISFDANGNITDVQTFTTGAQIVVQIVQGPDGNLYYVDLNDGLVGRWVFA